MRFEGPSRSRAGVSTNRWATGCHDGWTINDDGYLDIYVSRVRPPLVEGKKTGRISSSSTTRIALSPNLPSSTEIADTGFTTHAVLPRLQRRRLSRPLPAEQFATGFSRAATISTHPSGFEGRGTPGSHNELYRNNCNGTFTNVSEQAGIARESSFGLGVAVADLNGDGPCPTSMYRATVTPNDHRVHEQRKWNVSRNKRGEWLKHTSFARNGRGHRGISTTMAGRTIAQGGHAATRP